MYAKASVLFIVRDAASADPPQPPHAHGTLTESRSPTLLAKDIRGDGRACALAYGYDPDFTV